MSSNANAGHGCGDGYGYGGITRVTTVPGDTVRKFRTTAATSRSITITTGDHGHHGYRGTAGMVTMDTMVIMVTAAAFISRLVSRRIV